jgi:hypothetical protein
MPSEGKFYLENPDKLLYSEEATRGYIVGIHAMDNVPQAHAINQ